MLHFVFIILLAVVSTHAIDTSCRNKPTYRDYDSQRSNLAQIMDGLTVQARLIRTEPLYRVLSDKSVQTAMSSLLETVRQLKAAEKGGRDSDVFLAMLAIADDTCAYLTSRLNSSEEFQDFNCSQSQLQDIATRISTYTITNELRTMAINLVQAESPTCMSYTHECAYWNSHILNNCTLYDTSRAVTPRGSGTTVELGPGDSEANQLASVQRHVLERMWGYRRFCSGTRQFCPVPTVLL